MAFILSAVIVFAPPSSKTDTASALPAHGDGTLFSRGSPIETRMTRITHSPSLTLAVEITLRQTKPNDIMKSTEL